MPGKQLNFYMQVSFLWWKFILRMVQFMVDSEDLWFTSCTSKTIILKEVLSLFKIFPSKIELFYLLQLTMVKWIFAWSWIISKKPLIMSPAISQEVEGAILSSLITSCDLTCRHWCMLLRVDSIRHATNLKSIFFTETIEGFEANNNILWKLTCHLQHENKGCSRNRHTKGKKE